MCCFTWPNMFHFLFKFLMFAFFVSYVNTRTKFDWKKWVLANFFYYLCTSLNLPPLVIKVSKRLVWEFTGNLQLTVFIWWRWLLQTGNHLNLASSEVPIWPMILFADLTSQGSGSINHGNQHLKDLSPITNYFGSPHTSKALSYFYKKLYLQLRGALMQKSPHHYYLFYLMLIIFSKVMIINFPSWLRDRELDPMLPAARGF